MKRLAIALLLLFVSLASFGQDITFDGKKNGKLLFHRGRLRIEAECVSSGMTETEDSKTLLCGLVGTPGDSTREGTFGKTCPQNVGATYFLGIDKLDFYFFTDECDRVAMDRLHIISEYIQEQTK